MLYLSLIGAGNYIITDADFIITGADYKIAVTD